jgi:hypothetical protein
MSSPSENAFSKFVPGFDFLQGLVKNAGAALPGIGQWVAPTLNPEELEKRIEELRTVQFWLEQNARMLGATIQALEVQRMTLSTLKSMDVPLSALRESLKIPTPAAFEAKAAPEPAPAPKPKAERTPATEGSSPLAIDPTQWWGALTQQFTQLAANAMKDTATDAAKHLAGAIVKQSFDVAGEAVRKAATMPGAMAGSAVSKAAKSLKPRAAAKKSGTVARKRKT